MENLRTWNVGHIKVVMKERMNYEMKQDKAVIFPEKLCSIVGHDTGQLAARLPHFVAKPKGEQDRALKICSPGLLQHKAAANLYLCIMTEEDERELTTLWRPYIALPLI